MDVPHGKTHDPLAVRHHHDAGLGCWPQDAGNRKQGTTMSASSGCRPSVAQPGFPAAGSPSRRPGDVVASKPGVRSHHGRSRASLLAHSPAAVAVIPASVISRRVFSHGGSAATRCRRRAVRLAPFRTCAGVERRDRRPRPRKTGRPASKPGVRSRSRGRSTSQERSPNRKGVCSPAGCLFPHSGIRISPGTFSNS